MPNRNDPYFMFNRPGETDLFEHLEILTKAVRAFRDLAEQATESRAELQKATEDLATTTRTTLEEPLQKLSGHMATLQALAKTEGDSSARAASVMEEVKETLETLKTTLETVTRELIASLKANQAVVSAIAAPRSEPGGPDPDRSWRRIQVEVTDLDYLGNPKSLELVKVE